MKKKLFAILLSTILTSTMATPAFAEIIWTQDKLPEGYTTNEWENKDFSTHSGGAIKKDTWTGYVKDLHGNIMKSTVFAGGAKTDNNGVLIYADGHICAYGTELAEIEYYNTQPYEQYTWHQNKSKSNKNNGISNYWYGSTKYGSGPTSSWQWLLTSPDGNNDGLLRAYCFNEYGFLYTNTITPDGYRVNELGQLMIDGKVKTHETSDGNKWYGYVSFPIGYLGYDFDSCGRVAETYGTPNPFF